MSRAYISQASYWAGGATLGCVRLESRKCVYFALSGSRSQTSRKHTPAGRYSLFCDDFGHPRGNRGVRSQHRLARRALKPLHISFFANGQARPRKASMVVTSEITPFERSQDPLLQPAHAPTSCQFAHVCQEDEKKALATSRQMTGKCRNAAV